MSGTDCGRGITALASPAMDAPVTFRSEQRLTQAEFFAWLQRRPADDIHHYELIQGRIVMSPPASFVHGKLDSVLNQKIRNHVERLGLGIVLGSSAGYDLPSGDTLEPDVSFIGRQRLEAAPTQPADRFCRIAPDLAIEILSPATARRDRTEKKRIYAANGVAEYWIVDPQKRAVTIFRLAGKAYEAGTIATAGRLPSRVLPGLELSVEDLFRPS